MKKISLEQLAERLGKTVWSKGELKRIYLKEAGWNTKKMTTKAFIWQGKDGEFRVSCHVYCPSQPRVWEKSQEAEVISAVEEDIKNALAGIAAEQPELAQQPTQIDPEVTERKEPAKELLDYFLNLKKAQKAEQERIGSLYTGRVESGSKYKTLWVPSRTYNRTATIDLNHTLEGFDAEGKLWGENGNCGTSYRIILLPGGFEEKDLQRLGELVNEKCGNEFPAWHNALRVSNIDIIEETLKEMYPNG
jgi:FtsZ-binding cell division protein ZapB